MINNNFTLIHGDTFEILPKFTNEFDLIFADPPYFLSNDGLSIQSGKIVSVNKGMWDKGENIDEIDDPWYTREFDRCFDEINEGCIGLFNYLVDKGLKDEV